jgi:mono/diheme cytochrome c family protein
MGRSRTSARTVLIAFVCGASLWVEALGATVGGEGNVARGKSLFIKYCAGCHGSEGRGEGYKLLGPDPANLAAPETKKKSDAELLKTIHTGKPNMPAWNVRLSKEESRDVLAYIRTLAK